MIETSGPISYRRLKSGGYELTRDWWCWSELLKNCAARVDGYIEQTSAGKLTIFATYKSDGPSGPTLDTPDFMAAAFAHDAGYQLLRARKVPPAWRKRYDELLYQIVRSRGMPGYRAQWVYWGLRFGGAHAARPAQEPETRTMVAP